MIFEKEYVQPIDKRRILLCTVDSRDPTATPAPSAYDDVIVSNFHDSNAEYSPITNEMRFCFDYVRTSDLP